MRKKTFKVLFKDGEPEFIEAQRYRREGEQYVFESDGDTEVQFVDAGTVRGIIIVEGASGGPVDLE